MNESSHHIREATPLFQRLHRARHAAVEGRGLDPSAYRATLVAEEQPVVAAIERRGFDRLGVGAGRVVFRVPESECVVKVARYGETEADDGRRQNQNEVRTWEQADTDLNLAPVCDADRDAWSYIVMPKYDLLADVLADDLDQRERLVDSLQTQLLDADVFVKLLDVREENIGVEGDEVVLFDYGLSGNRDSVTSSHD